MARLLERTDVEEIEECLPEAPRLTIVDDPRLARRVRALQVEFAAPAPPPREGRRTSPNTRGFPASRSVDFVYD